VRSHTIIDGQCDAPLFAAARARVNDPITSHEAAAHKLSSVESDEQLILASLRQGPAGASEIARRTGGLSNVAVNRRLAKMRDKGLIERTGRAVQNQGGHLELEHELASR